MPTALRPSLPRPAAPRAALRRRLRGRLLATCLLGAGALGLLPGCGEDAPAPAVVPAPQPEAAPADLLRYLHERVAAGGAMDRGFQEASTRLQGLWWGQAGDEAAQRARAVHGILLHTAGGVGVELTQEPREAVAARDALGLEVHDAWLAAAAQGPEAYRAWCAGEGVEVYRRFEAARQAQLFGPR